MAESGLWGRVKNRLEVLLLFYVAPRLEHFKAWAQPLLSTESPTIELAMGCASSQLGGLAVIKTSYVVTQGSTNETEAAQPFVSHSIISALLLVEPVTT